MYSNSNTHTPAYYFLILCLLSKFYTRNIIIYNLINVYDLWVYISLQIIQDKLNTDDDGNLYQYIDI